MRSAFERKKVFTTCCSNSRLFVAVSGTTLRTFVSTTLGLGAEVEPGQRLLARPGLRLLERSPPALPLGLDLPHPLGDARGVRVELEGELVLVHRLVLELAAGEPPGQGDVVVRRAQPCALEGAPVLHVVGRVLHGLLVLEDGAVVVLEALG